MRVQISPLFPPLLAIAVLLPGCRTDAVPAAPNPPSTEPARPSPEAQPGTFEPDANETSADWKSRYQEARARIASGRWSDAETTLQQALERYPESRHLRQLHAELLWYRSAEGQDRALLEQAAREAVAATEAGLRQGKVDPAFTAQLGRYLGLLGDRERLDRIFSRLLARTPDSLTYLAYGQALARMDDPRAEDILRKALQAQPDSGDVLAAYGEWLLDHGRESEALSVLPEETPLYYLHFLRGVALERLRRPQEAKTEYARFAEYSQTFPAPARFQIPGSTLQAESGIRFEQEERNAKNEP